MPTNCDFCQSPLLKHYTISRFDSPFEILKCPSCGLLRQAILPDFKSNENLYQEGYYTGQNTDFVYEDERKTFTYHSKVWQKRIKKLLENLKTSGEKPAILDIGCSFGGLLKNALYLGMEPYGIEISDYSRAYAQKEFPGRIFKTLEEASFPQQKFDAIVMIEVIEHLPDPVFYLKEIYRLLKPGGLLLLQTANMEGRQARKARESYHYFLPGHLFYFSRHNLSNKLGEIGFSSTKFFHPVEFGLIPKLQKSRGQFTRLRDYLKWLPIIRYHLKSLLHWNNHCLTSSMVLYSWK